MNYKREIINLIMQVKEERALRFIYKLLVHYLEGNTKPEGTIKKAA